MTSTNGQARSGWVALWVASTAAIVALLAWAAPAAGQTIQAAGDAPVEGAEAAPEPVPAEAPEVAAVAEEPAAVAPPSAPSSSPPPASPEPGPTGTASDAVSAALPEADRPVSGLVAKAAEGTSGAVGDTAGAASGGTLTEQLPEPVAQVAKRAGELSDEAQARTIGLAASVEEVGLAALSGGSPGGPSQAPTAPAAAPNQSFPLHQAPVGRGLLAGAWLAHRTASPGGLPATYMAGAGAIDLLRAGAPSDLGEPLGPSPYTATGGITGAIQQFNGPASPDGPGAPSGATTGLGAPGSGASFFVPIAALLALLALASPAIVRRLREPPYFPAPTPFVCALERPG